MRRFSSLPAFCALLCGLFGLTTQPAHAQSDPGGYRDPALHVVFFTGVYDSDDNLTSVLPTGTSVPSNAILQDMYASDNPGGGYTTVGIVLDGANQPVGDPVFVQAGSFADGTGDPEIRKRLPLLSIVYDSWYQAYDFK